MPGSSWRRSPPTSSGCRAARCWKRWCTARRTPRGWPTWRGASCARSCRRCARRWLDAPHHAFLVSQLLAHVDYLDEAIATVSEEVEGRLAPFAAQLTQLDTIPGINKRTAEVIIAELGVDMSCFPSDRHLASWAGICPGNNESAGKHKSGKTRKGNRWL